MTRPSLAVLLGPSPRVGAQEHFPASGIERCARPSNGLALCLSTRMAAARAYACVSVRGQRAPEAELAQGILFLQRPIESRGHPRNSRTPDPALGVGDASTPCAPYKLRLSSPVCGPPSCTIRWQQVSLNRPSRRSAHKRGDKPGVGGTGSVNGTSTNDFLRILRGRCPRRE